MNALVATLQAVPGGVGAALLVQIFRMWRRGDLIPKFVVELMMAARKEDREQIELLVRSLTEALESRGSPPRHGRES